MTGGHSHDSFAHGSQTALRRRNEEAILKALLEAHAGLTRSELARRAGLSAAGLANVLAGPLGTVIQAGDRRADRSRTGPVPATLRIGATLGYLVAIDLSYTGTRVWLTDLYGRPTQPELESPPAPPGEAMRIVAEAAHSLIAQAPPKPDGAPVEAADVVGVAVALPDAVGRNGEVRARGPGVPWASVRVEANLREMTNWDCPFRVESDVKLGALGELRWGAARGRLDVVHVRWAARIRAALVAGGRLWSGSGGMAGEIAHAPILLDEGHAESPPARCPDCGRHCLTSVAGRPAILRDVRAERREMWTMADALRAAATDERVQCALERAGAYLGQALAAIVDSVNPELITIGGDLGGGHRYVAGGIQAGLREYADPRAARDVVVAGSQLTTHETLLGGIALLIEEECVPFLIRRARIVDSP